MVSSFYQQVLSALIYVHKVCRTNHEHQHPGVGEIRWTLHGGKMAPSSSSFDGGAVMTAVRRPDMYRKISCHGSEDLNMNSAGCCPTESPNV